MPEVVSHYKIVNIEKLRPLTFHRRVKLKLNLKRSKSLFNSLKSTKILRRKEKRPSKRLENRNHKIFM